MLTFSAVRIQIRFDFKIVEPVVQTVITVDLYGASVLFRRPCETVLVRLYIKVQQGSLVEGLVRPK